MMVKAPDFNFSHKSPRRGQDGAGAWGSERNVTSGGRHGPGPQLTEW